MNFLRFLYDQSGRLGYFFLLLGIISGIANAAILKLIDNVMTAAGGDEGIHGIDVKRSGIYLAVLAVLFVTQRMFAKYIIQLSQTIIFDLRLSILNDIRLSGYSDFKSAGRERIYTSLTQDTEKISAAAASTVYAITNLVTVVFCLAYLAYASLAGFALTLGVIGLGIMVYWIRQKKIHRDLSAARDLQTTLFGYVDELLQGFKEVKVHHGKNEDLYENHIRSVSNETKGLGIKAITGYIDNSLTGRMFFFLLIGFILFVLPVITNNTAVVLSYVFIILYIMGPLEGFMAVIPAITQADIAIDRIHAIRRETASIQEKRGSNERNYSSFSKIVFEGVNFHYPVKNNERFSIGPIDLTIEKGDLLFIAGGNGSGKTTFFKLLTGLYYPAQGNIFIDGEAVNDHASYRSLFSPIYSDFHLFRHFYGMKNVQPELVNEYLRLMQLEEKVQFADGKFSKINLSTGQRKRLALIISLLEERPILVLDEWAADQDPHFRKFFYEEFLPSLRKKGKTIIAITHDDRYFHVADKTFKMEYGKLAEERLQNSAVPL